MQMPPVRNDVVTQFRHYLRRLSLVRDMHESILQYVAKERLIVLYASEYLVTRQQVQLMRIMFQADDFGATRQYASISGHSVSRHIFVTIYDSETINIENACYLQECPTT